MKVTTVKNVKTIRDAVTGDSDIYSCASGELLRLMMWFNRNYRVGGFFSINSC